MLGMQPMGLLGGSSPWPWPFGTTTPSTSAVGRHPDTSDTSDTQTLDTQTRSDTTHASHLSRALRHRLDTGQTPLTLLTPVSIDTAQTRLRHGSDTAQTRLTPPTLRHNRAQPIGSDIAATQTAGVPGDALSHSSLHPPYRARTWGENVRTFAQNAPGHVCGCAGVRAGVCAGNCAGACAGRARAVGGPMQVWPFGYWAWPATFHIGRRGAAALAHWLQRPVWPMQQPPSSASRSGCSARAWHHCYIASGCTVQHHV